MVSASSGKFSIDYAPTGRASCKTCSRLIGQSQLRIGVKERSPWHDRFDTRYHHLACARARVLEEHAAIANNSDELLSAIAGAYTLKWNDLTRLLQILKLDALDPSADLVKSYQARNCALWKLHSALTPAPLKTLTTALEENGVFFDPHIKAPEAAWLVADCLLFGILPSCPLCRTTGLRQAGPLIRCDGFVENSNIRCSFGFRLHFLARPDVLPDNKGSGLMDVEWLSRKSAFHLTPALEKLPSLQAWKRPEAFPAPTSRLSSTEDSSSIHDISNSSQTSQNQADNSDTEDERSVPLGQELCGIAFSAVGSTFPDRYALQQMILEHGGVFEDTLTDKTVYLLVGDNLQAAHQTKRYHDALARGISILHCSFVPALLARTPSLPSAKKRRTSSADPQKAGSAQKASTLPQGLILRRRRYARAYLRGGVMPPHPLPTVKESLALKKKDEAALKESREFAPVLRNPIHPDSAVLKIDPDYKPTPSERIYVDPLNNAFHCTTVFTDVTSGVNKFYNQQLIEKPGNNGLRQSTTKYNLFRRWGRIGTTDKKKRYNGFLKESFGNSLEEAIDAFKQRCYRLTHIDWDDRYTKPPVPGKYRYVFLDHEAPLPENVKNGQAEAQEASMLADRVQELLRLIFNQAMMKDSLEKQNCDMTRMPLGSISRSQLTEGYEILSAIQALLLPEIEENSTENSKEEASNAFPVQHPMLWRESKLAALSSKFYAAIPHTFPDRKNVPLLDTLGKLKAKVDLLEQLLGISIANSIMHEPSQAHPSKNRLDVYYCNLRCHLEPVSPQSELFATIQKAVQHTHAITHTAFSIKIVDCYRCEREGELEAYKAFLSVAASKTADGAAPQRRLLWHGSRLSNWPSIFQQGLRVAPKEAPSSGYMFGKGVYFADMVSKSAQYCYASPENLDGLLVLSEVILGEPYRRFEAQSTARKKCQALGKLHTWGVGKTTPDPAGDAFCAPSPADGQLIPLASGKGIAWRPTPDDLLPDKSTPEPSLLYNEYIVYDVSQILMRYILRVAFEYPSIDDTLELSSVSSSDEDSS